MTGPWRAALVFVVLGVASCGGGGGDDAVDLSTVNLDGWWSMDYRATGSGDVFHELGIVQAEDTGDTWAMSWQVFDRDGANLTVYDPSEDAPDRTEMLLAVRSADLVDGVLCGWTDGWAGGCMDLRIQRRAPPEGTLNLLGTVMGVPVAVDCDTAYAVMGWHDVWHEYDVYDRQPYGGSDISLNFMAGPGLPAVGTYDVMLDDVAVQVRVDDEWGFADTGTVTLTVSTVDRVAGSLEVDLDGGGSASASFDVDILLTYGESPPPVPGWGP